MSQDKKHTFEIEFFLIFLTVKLQKKFLLCNFSSQKFRINKTHLIFINPCYQIKISLCNKILRYLCPYLIYIHEAKIFFFRALNFFPRLQEFLLNLVHFYTHNTFYSLPIDFVYTNRSTSLWSQYLF
ncbi:hypothetical protein BpHYR1_046772 [Brachionus plicatilis]|uniref:Uncharacterized protein n=1 Tax=Brachionus plicatilis TaxID=10195 RepID=A0A3M7Q1Y8_BRAPC|nr:hypothetical protein BpHYR1_046772 [Brachionus plicatilis]